MEKHYNVVLMFLSLTIVAHAIDITTFGSPKETITRLQFYVQDIFSSPTPTNIVVASANSSNTSPTSFGIVAVIDDPVRTRPDPSADIFGRAQGFFAFASLEETSLHMSLDIVFTSGQYNGSVLNLVGRNPYLRNFRQLSVVGGLGAFKMARGFVGIRTVSMNSSTGDAFFEYNVTVLHYQFNDWILN